MNIRRFKITKRSDDSVVAFGVAWPNGTYSICGVDWTSAMTYPTLQELTYDWSIDEPEESYDDPATNNLVWIDELPTQPHAYAKESSPTV